MHLIYFDESGQTGTNYGDKNQPVFVLAALVVPEADWLAIERALKDLVKAHFPGCPEDLEIHAKALRNGEGFFRKIKVEARLDFMDACLSVAATHGLKVIYRSIEKKKFKAWVEDQFSKGVAINPHVVAFPLVARVVNDHLRSLAGSPLGIFISDENREITLDVEKSIRLLRGHDGALKLDQIIEKGFFIDSKASLLLQLCDLCAYFCRKREEAELGIALKSTDVRGVKNISALIHRGHEAFEDTMEWLVSEQKKERPGDKPKVG